MIGTDLLRNIQCVECLLLDRIQIIGAGKDCSRYLWVLVLKLAIFEVWANSEKKSQPYPCH